MQQSTNINGPKKARGEGRVQLIAPLAQLLDVRATRRFPHLLPDGSRAWSLTDAATWCAERNGRSLRTVWRTIAVFKSGGNVALERNFRRDKGRSRFFARYDKAAVLAAYLHLALKPSCRAIFKSIVRNRELLGVPETKAPSYETVRSWLRFAPSALVALGLEGQRAFRELMFSEIERGLLPSPDDRSE